MKIKLWATISVLLGTVTAFGAAASGNCMARAVTLKASQSVRLVNEWDPDFKEYWESGVYYYKVTLMKGLAYTIWITGGNAADIDLTVDTNWEDESAPLAMFEPQDFNGGALRAAYLYADAWDSEDPSSGTYYVKLSGDIDAQTTLFFTTGIQGFLAEGAEGNPRRLNFTESVQSHATSLLESEYGGGGDYYYIAQLTAGRKYRFRLNGSTAASPLSVDVSGANFVIEDDPLFTNRTDIIVKLIYAGETADYVFNIASTNLPTQAFSINYMTYKVRLPAEHDNITPLTAGNSYEASVQPGREVADANLYYDDVIDESLLSISVKKGDRWVFQTEDATFPILMRAYDASGKILNENTTMGNGAFDTRTVISASADATYYVGVCDPLLDVVSVPQGSNVTVFAKNALDFDGPDDYDEFDTADDTIDGASMLVTYPGSASSRVPQVAKGHGPHVLSGGDWYDWFTFPGRKNVTYALKASFATLAVSDVPLNATVWKVVSGVRTRVTTRGSLLPEEVASEAAALTFTADEDAMYYVCVYAGTGGQDYPAYNLHAMAYVEGTAIGLVRVTTKGVDGTWRFSNGSFLYPNGASVIAPVGRDFTVTFPDVSGFKTPAAIVTNVVAYSAGESEEVSEVVGVYTDTADPDDDVYTGFVRITPEKATGKTARTLWTDDPADHFLFRAEAGKYYNFMIVDRTQDQPGGDAVFSIASAKTVADLDNPLVSGVEQGLKMSFEAGNYLVKVEHANASAADSSYIFAYNCVDVGTVQFASTPIVVSEDAEYADISVTRTSPDGAVRVRWATEAGTAKPGSEYYPDDDVLEWADGDMSPKTIRVRLIPDLMDKWEPTLYFGVKLQALPEDSWEADEYGAVIAGPAKVAVKLTESSAKAPGSIAVAAVSSVVAGNPAEVTLMRTGGTDGSVGVVVATIAGTAVRGEDFAFVQTNLVWEAGDGAPKTFAVPTYARGALGEKTFSLKVASLRSAFPAQYGGLDDPASVSGDGASVTIASEVCVRTLEDLMAEPAFSGVAATPIAGDLYVDASGALRSSAAPAGGKVVFRFRVTGPGLFVMEPRLEDADEGASFLFQVSGGEIQDCAGGERLVVPVGPGGRNIAFVARSPSGTAYASLQPLSETGLPFKWIPFSSMEPASPLDGAVVDASLGSVSWTAPAGLTGEEMWYRVRASAKGADASAFTAVFTNMTTDAACAVPAGLLRAGRQFWWRVDCAYVGSAKDEPEEGDWMEGPSVWTFRTAEVLAPATVPAARAQAPDGTLVADLVAGGEPVRLVQGARVDFALAAAGVGAAVGGTEVVSAGVAAGALPPGMKLTAAGRIYGVPKEAGEFRALVQVNGGTTLTLDFDVASAGTAAGAFCGVLREDGTAAPASARIGALSFSATEAGALSAKAKVDGETHVFAGSGYEAVLFRDGAPGQTAELAVTLREVVSVDGQTFTNVLEVTVGSGSPTNLAALVESAGTASLTLNLPASGGGAQEVSYRCALVRRNADSTAFVEAMSAFAGYYTVSIVPQGASPAAGLPCGNGPMALTVSSDGTVKVSGVLPDRTSFSSSAFAGLRGDPADPDNAVLVVPVVYAAPPDAFGGLLKIRRGSADGAPYVDSYAELEWSKAGGAFDGVDFRLAANPVGGWYDTVVNLQRYYLDRDFTVEAEPVAGIPEGMLPAGYVYTADTTPHGVEATLAGDVLKAAARKVVKTEDGTRVDFDGSVNAWDVKLSFARGSGLVTGTAAVVSDGERQTTLGTVNHYGILLMNRDPAAPLDADVWTAGFYQFPAGNGWKHSLPFNIRSVTVDRDWSETELPDSE